MVAGQEDVSPSEEIEKNIIYEQWHEELRYYRLYEQAAAFWASTVLLAFLAGALAIATAHKPPDLTDGQRWLLTIAPFLFAVCASFIVGYAAWRYRQLRNQWNRMEPQWKRDLDEEFVKPLPLVFNPTVAQIALLLLLGVIAAVAISAVMG